MTVVLVLFKALQHKTVTIGEKNKREKKEKQCFKTLTRSRKTMQRTVRLFARELVGFSIRWSVSTASTQWNSTGTRTASPLPMSRTKSSFHIRWKAKVNSFQKCERIWRLWTMHEAQRPKTSHELWLLFLLCLLLICLIWVSIKRYEMQSVQIDIAWAIFIHLAKIQPL